MEKETITITRKYTLIPTFSDTREWTKKIMEYTKSSYDKKISYYEEKLTKTKGKEEKDKIRNRLNTLNKQKEEFESSGTLTQSDVNNYTYDLVRAAMSSEAQRKNVIISYVFSELVNRDAMSMDFHDRNVLIQELCKKGYRVKGSSKGSLYDAIDIDNPLKGYGVAFSQELTRKIKDMVNRGHVLEGGSSLVSYKLDSPFSVAKDVISFSHDYDSYEELCEHIKDNDCNLYFNFGGNGKPTMARFKINLGAGRHKNNKEELIATILKIYSGEYKYCGSSIGIEKNKIILNLSMTIPVKKTELDENVVVGVNLGLLVPAMCALNNNDWERAAIGNADDFLRIRVQLQEQRRRLQKSLKYTSGGHGRRKKLQSMDKLRNREKNFVETYCHIISREIVDFAVKHNAKYINLENLKGYDTEDFVLRNWSYYKIQQYVKYKAALYGIEVRLINPCYNAQVCSFCGNWSPTQRKSRELFVCDNPECKSHKLYKRGMNADFNNARNNAMSTLFMKDGEVTSNKFKEAMEYYGIEQMDSDSGEEEK